MDEQPFDLLQTALADLDAAQLGLVVDFAQLLTCPEGSADSELADGAVTAVRLSAVVEGCGARWLRRFEASGVWGFDGARSGAAWLDSHAETSKARAGSMLKRARTLPALPVFDTRLRVSGTLGAEKIKLLLDVHRRLPGEVGEAQVLLRDEVVRRSVEGAHVFIEGWYERNRPQVPDGDETGPAPGSEGSHFVLPQTTGGSHVGGFLETDDAATTQGALDAEITSWRRAGLLDGDTRTLPQLQAAAITAICARHGLTGDQHGQLRPLALILADADTLAGRIPTAGSPNMDPVCEIVGHGPIPAEVARRLLCGADISRIILRGGSEVLDVGMRHRLATGAQRRGIIAAAGGRCEFAGCDAPHHWCEVHHLDPFNPKASTGPTDLANLALVCSRHHHALHEGHYTLTRGPAGVVTRRPDGTTIDIPKAHRPGPNPRDG